MKQKILIASWIILFTLAQFAQQEPKQNNFDFNSKLNWTGKCGYWDFSNKIFRGQGFIRYNIAYYNQHIFSDFIYEVKFNKLSEDGTLGILFRYNENRDEGYLIHLWPHGGCLFVLFEKGMEKVKLKINQPINQLIGTHVWNTIKVVAKANKFKIYLNQHLLDTISDKKYKSGRLGLYIGADPRQAALFEIINIKAR